MFIKIDIEKFISTITVVKFFDETSFHYADFKINYPLFFYFKDTEFTEQQQYFIYVVLSLENLHNYKNNSILTLIQLFKVVIPIKVIKNIVIEGYIYRVHPGIHKFFNRFFSPYLTAKSIANL